MDVCGKTDWGWLSDGVFKGPTACVRGAIRVAVGGSDGVFLYGIRRKRMNIKFCCFRV